jgi:hypothetical protein
MGLLSWTVGLPLAPVRGLLGLGRVIRQQADEQLHDPAAVRRRLEGLDEEMRAGRVDPRTAARQQAEITGAMIRPRPAGAATRRPRESDRT